MKYWDMQELAGLLAGLSEKETENIINDDEDFDTPLLEKLGVDFEQFSNIANALLGGDLMQIGYSPLSKRIYMGAQRESLWVGGKKDITSAFIQVMEHKFPINTSQNISVDGEDKYRVIVLDMEKEVLVNGKNPFSNKEEKQAKK